VTEEEINIIRTIMREEISTAIGATEQRMDERFAATEQRTDARFVALEQRMDERFAATEQRTDARFVALEQRIEVGFASTNQQIATMDKRITSLSEQVTNLDEQIDGIDDQLVNIDERVQNINRYLNTTIPPMVERLGRLENIVEPMSGHLVLLRASQRELQDKFTKLESSQVKTQSDVVQILAILNGVIIRINEVENRLFDEITKTNKRIELHENTPVDQAHPRPNSPYSIA